MGSSSSSARSRRGSSSGGWDSASSFGGSGLYDSIDVFSVAGQSKALKSRTRMLNRLTSLNLFVFFFIAMVSVLISIVMTNTTNFSEESLGFRSAYAGGYVLIFVGAILTWATLKRWGAYSLGYEDKLQNRVNYVPYWTGGLALFCTLGGSACLLASIFVFKGKGKKGSDATTGPAAP